MASLYQHRNKKLIPPLPGSYLYQSSYDFIIIGSGPAGCVLANRLSANPDWTVLLIEAGQPESVIQSIPLATSFTSSSKYVRKYFFERDSGACLSELNDH